MPATSTNSHNFVPQYASAPSYETILKSANMQGDMSPRFEDNLESSEDIWLTVSEVPLFTQPTSAPPPSRPPPPRPVQISRAESGSYTSTNSRKKVNDYSSSPKMTQYFHVPESAPDAVRESVVAPVDEFEDFAMGRGRSNVDARSDGFTSEELEMNSAAAAMKEAMDRAEAKFRHAKEVRGRESSKTGRSKEAVHLDKDENIMQDEKSEKVEQLQREKEEEEQRRLQKEREKAREIEREQRRLQKERERARELEEREKARQAVERATREARERAAAEARLKAERAAVQRAQAEARERAAADARVRAEKVAAEARERASAESKEREAQERAAIARAEAEARAKAERAAVQRAAQEARERAAAGARERAAAAARVNQQKSENDLENFFMAGRATSAPRPRANANSVVRI